MMAVFLLVLLSLVPLLTSASSTYEALCTFGEHIRILEGPNTVVGWNCDVERAFTSEEVCKWSGITCRDSVPYSLDLPSFGLTGSIPEVSLPFHLIDLSSNNLMGSIPSSLFTSSLESLNLAKNRLTGSLPDDLLNAIHLRHIDVSHNALMGDLPAGLADHPSLTDLVTTSTQIAVTNLRRLTSTPAPSIAPTRFPTVAPTVAEVRPIVFFADYSPTKTTFTVSAFLSGDGSAYVGVFPLGYSSPSISEIVIQNRYSKAVDNVVTITVSGLTPATLYDTYLYILSPGGFGSSVTSVLTTKRTVETLCCKALKINFPSLTAKEQVSTLNYMTIAPDASPSETITLSALPVLNHNDGTTVYPFSPTSVTFDTKSWKTSRSFTLTSLMPGNYTLDVSAVFGGASKNEYEIVYSNGATFTILPMFSIPPVPVVREARFSSDGLRVFVAFDSSTNKMDGADFFACATLFNFALVSSSTCQWTDASSITITLAARSSLIPGNTITLLGDKVRAVCSVGIQCSQLQYVPATTLTLLRPTTPVRPVVAIFGPASVSYCATPIIDVSASTGSLGRAWQTPQYTVVSTDSASGAALQSFFTTTYKLNPPTAIPQGILVVGHRYDITVKLCNFMSECGSSVHRISVVDTTAPTVSILGGKYRTQTAATSLSLTSNAYIPACGGGTSTASLQYEWSVLLEGVDATSIVSESTKDLSKFRLSPYKLTPLKNYVIELKVTNTQSAMSTKASVVVQIEQGLLVALIAGGSSQLVRKGDTLTLDGGSSFDEDRTVSIVNPSTFTYSWSCFQLTPEYKSECGFTMNLIDGGKKVALTPLSATQVGSTHSVTLTFADTARQSSATIGVTVTTPEAPKLTISSVFDTKVNPSSQLKIEARAQLTYDSTAVWTVDDPSLILSKQTLTPTSVAVVPGMNTVNLVLLANAMNFGRKTYVFTLTCDSVVTSTKVVVNSPPTNGKLISNPVNGTALDTNFVFSAYDWVDEDIPVTYEFGYLTIAKLRMGIQSRSERSYTSSKLPAGNEKSNDELIVFARVLDVLNAETFSTISVEVVKVILSTDQLKNKASEELASVGASADSAKKAISLVSSMLNTRDCSAAPNCTARNRGPCAAVDNTCGKCFSGYIGEEGNSNAMCTKESVAPSPSVCNSDTDCSVIETCNAQKSCVKKPKKCDCSGQGSCSYRIIDTGVAVTECLMGNSKCESVCACNSGYSGATCAVSADELIEKQNLRENLLTHLETVTVTDDNSIDNVVSWVTSLSAVTQSVDELSSNAVDSAIDIANQIVSEAAAGGVSYDQLLGLLDSVNAATLAKYATISTGRRLSSVNGSNVVSVLEQYGAMSGAGMVSGQHSIDATYPLFSVSSQIVDNNDDASFSQAQADSGVPVSYCMIKTDSIENDLRAVVITTSALSHASQASYNSNPFRLKTLKDAAITEATCVLQNIVEETFAVYESNTWHNTTCLKGDMSTYEYFCYAPDGSNVTVMHTCNGTKAEIVTKCPTYKVLPTCQILSGGEAMECEVVEFTATNTTCHCVGDDRRRRLLSLEESGLLEIAALSVMVGEDFGETIMTADNFNSLDDLKRVLIVIILYGALWAVGICAVAVFAWRHRKNTQQRSRHAVFPDVRSADAIREKLTNYIGCILPDVFGAESPAIRLWTEIKHHHRYIQLFTVTGTQRDRNRMICAIHLMTVQTMLMFMLAVLYDTEFPEDDGTCKSYVDEDQCLKEKSVFDQSTTTCRWIENEEGEFKCVYTDRDLTWNVCCVIFQFFIDLCQMVIIISIVVAVFTSPMNSFVDFLFIDMLSAPTADEERLEAQDSFINRAQQSVANVVRRASVAGQRMVENIQTAVRRKTSFINTRFTRVLPDDAVNARAQARLSARDIMIQASEYHDRFDQQAKTRRRSSLTRRSDSHSEQKQDSGDDDVQMTPEEAMVCLREDMAEQRMLLRGKQRVVFDSAWGLNGDGDFGTESIEGRFCNSRVHVGALLQKELRSVHQEIEEKLAKLTLATDDQVGLEMLHMFMLDLLGRNSCAAKIFMMKADEDFKHKMVLSKFQKALLWTVVVVMNLFFVYFSILRGAQRGYAWQRNFAMACTLQILIEIFVYETSECIVMSFLIPSVVTNEVRSAFFAVKQIIQSIASKSYLGQKSVLDVPQYLFVSTNVAKHFPNLVESVIIRSYHTYLPGELRRSWGKGNIRYGDSLMARFVRAFAIATILINAVKGFAMLPGEVQRLFVHALQPLIVSAFVLMIVLITQHPIFAAFPIVIVGLGTYILYREIRREQGRKNLIIPMQGVRTAHEDDDSDDMEDMSDEEPDDVEVVDKTNLSTIKKKLAVIEGGAEDLTQPMTASDRSSSAKLSRVFSKDAEDEIQPAENALNDFIESHFLPADDAFGSDDL